MQTGAPNSPRWSLSLLGPFALRATDNHPIPDLRRKARALLAYLATAQRPYSRHELASFLCQEADSPLGALRHLLSRLRAALGPEIFFEEGETIRFNFNQIEVDVQSFTQKLTTNLSQLSLEVLAEAIALYQGEFLTGLYLSEAPEFELWLLGYRTYLNNLYERGALHLLDRYTEQAQIEAAIPLAQQLVQHNPLLEEAHYRLILFYAQTNQRTASLEQYERCHQLLADELAVEPMPALVTLYADVLAGRFRPPAPVVSPKIPTWFTAADFVARETEMTHLETAWTVAQQGQNPLVLITAEAGGGKTRLVREFMATLPQGVSLVGQCYESTRALAYQPWTQLLENLLTTLGVRWQTLPAHWMDELARFLPSLAVKRQSPTTPGKQDQLFAAVAALLRLVEQPILLFLDDLQWADTASLQLFHYVSERVGAPLLLIGAYRSEEVEENDGLLTLLRDVSRREQVTRLELPPLSSTAIEQLLEQLWPQLPTGYRIPHLRDRLNQATRGNPLFIGEIVRELTSTTHLPDELPVPPSLRDLIQRRLQQLPSSGRQVLETLAVLEQPATLDLAQQISARSEDETIQVLEAGLRWRLIRTDPDSHQMEFSHDLMRQAVSQQLNPLRRQLLHRRTAIALSRQKAKAATLVYHWRRAGDTEQEATYAFSAGKEAAGVYAQQEAIGYFERALELMPETAQRGEAMCDLADIWMVIGKWSEAETMYQQALTSAKKLEDLTIQGRCQTSLGKLMSRKNLYQEALEWLEQARITHTTLGDLRKAAQNVGTMGVVYWMLDEYDQALACYEQALQKERELGDQANMALWIGNIANVHHHRGEYLQALTGYQQSLEFLLASGKKMEAGINLGNIGNTYREMGDYQQAMVCYKQALQYRQEVGDEAGVATALGNMGALYLQMGQAPIALVCYLQALLIDSKLGQKLQVADNLGLVANLYLSEGSYELAQKLLDRSIPLSRRVSAKYSLCKQLLIQAELLYQGGQNVEAYVFCQESKAIAEGVRPEIQFAASLLSIRLAVALGQLTGAEGIESFKELLVKTTQDKERVAIQYEIWSLDPQQESVRQKTADLYRTLYASTPNILYCQRYQELMHQALPDPPPLPEHPEIMAENLMDMETLLMQVDQLLKEPS